MHQIKNGTNGPLHALSTQKGLPREVAGQGYGLSIRKDLGSKAGTVTLG